MVPPNVTDLNGKVGTGFQMGNTFNLFRLNQRTGSNDHSNIVLPIFHIQSGTFNKLIEALDRLVVQWESTRKWEDDEVSMGRKHLAKS